MKGKVYLIGAGPGDPELLTLKAVRCLGEADIVLVDALVDRRVLAYKRADARVIEVGKRGGCRSTPQEFIEKLMIRLARRGSIVARLKGGDPFVFGRGGEEAMALARAGVQFEVICGISAGIAAPVCAGIPVTHRGASSAVTFITAHPADGASIDWAAHVRSKATLVVFMGVAALREVAGGLLTAGMPADTPAAAIERATCPEQRIVRASLATLADRAAAVHSPAIFVIGKSVAVAAAIAGAACTDVIAVARAA